MASGQTAESFGIQVIPQGWAQQDLSIRGGSYAGTGISINGLNLKVPYSAHYNSEIPFPGNLLSDAVAQTGLENVSGHLVGTAAFNTVPLASRLQAKASAGTKEHFATSLSGQYEGVGGFAGWETARRIDHAANGLDRGAGGASLQTMKNDWTLDAIAAHQQKEFGTQGYRGVGSGEQRTEDSLLFLGATKGELDSSFLRAGTALRQFNLDEADSRFATAAVEGRTLEVQNIALNLRGDVEYESAGNLDRTRGAVLVLPQFSQGPFKLAAGLNSVFQTRESPEWLPQAGVDWYATDNSTLYAAYTESVQQPDYQSLENNPLLRQQTSQNTELGFRQFLSDRMDWRAAAFHRRLENASDWIGGAATALGTLHIDGLESEISFYPSEALELRGFYQWIHKDNDATGGLYETDYPEHLLAVSGHWMFVPQFDLFGTQTLRYQTENSTRTGSDFGANASLGLHWFPRFAHSVRLTLLVDNLWGSDFQSVAGVTPIGRTVSSGVTVAW